MSDLRLAFRTLTRRPVFAAAVVLTLGLAIGVTTGFFGVTNALLLRPLPGVGARGLVNVHVTQGGAAQGTSGFSAPSFRDLRERSRSFSAIEAFVGRGFVVGDGATTSVVGGQLVSGGLFRLLGTRAAHGRLLGEADDALGADRTAVVSEAFWRQRLGSREDVLGSEVRLNGRPFTVVGVAQEGFRGQFVGFPIDVYVPLAAAADVASDVLLESRTDDSLELIGRLCPGVGLAAAQAELSAIAAELERTYADQPHGLGVELRPYTGIDSDLRTPVLAFVGVLSVVSALVLLVACVNVAGLLLARGASRGRELAVRAAIGASRAGLVRPLLAETLLLFALGGVLGIAMARPAADALHRFLPDLPIPLHLDVSPDWRVALFAAVATLLASLAFGLAPARSASRIDVVEALKQGGRGVVPARSRARRVLLTAEVALSLVLLVGTGLFLRELQRSRGLDPGFRTAALGHVRVDLRLLNRPPAAMRAFFETWQDRVRSRPDVAAASLATALPLGLGRTTTRVSVDGVESPTPAGFLAGVNAVAPGYFGTLGIPLLAGRDFEPRDGEEAEPVAIVSRATAGKLFPGQDALGRQVRREARLLRIVGVVGDIAVDRSGRKDGLFVYVPLAQNPSPRVSLVLRAEGRLPLEGVRSEARALEPDLPVLAAQTFQQHAGAALFPQRLAAAVSAAFAMFAVLIASVGLYGLVAFFVVQRRQELAIRAALGARGLDLRRLALAEALPPVAIGIVAGLGGAVAFGRLAASFVPAVGPFDLVAFAGAALLLTAVAALAADVPARKAAGTSPMEALRSE